MVEEVILVNLKDEEIGKMEKMRAHKEAMLHRAFSVFILNDAKDKMLIQRRSESKYHSPKLWTNACCSHQRPGESNSEACKRRVYEELGISLSLEKLFDFVYKTPFENGLTEYEFDHVFLGTISENVSIPFNKEEVMEIKWMDIDLFKTNQYEKADFTFWFLEVIDRVLESI